MEYCTRCMYPANARPVIVFDDKGLCSGCRYVESRKSINWEERLVTYILFLIFNKLQPLPPPPHGK